MTTYQLSKINQDVRATLDQNLSDDTLSDLGDIETLTLDQLIANKVEDAVRRVHGEAPLYMLETGNNFGDAIYWMDDYAGYTLLPDDFHRLIVFQMDDWERPVFRAPFADTPGYDSQSSRFKGLRGTAQRPECFITMRPEGKALEFYSCTSEDALVSKAVYLPKCEVDEYEAINICELCYNAVIYTLAALILTAYGDTDKASVMLELAKSALV